MTCGFLHKSQYNTENSNNLLSLGILYRFVTYRSCSIYCLINSLHNSIVYSLFYVVIKKSYNKKVESSHKHFTKDLLFTSFQIPNILLVTKCYFYRFDQLTQARYCSYFHKLKYIWSAILFCLCRSKFTETYTHVQMDSSL